ncbi:hypothetical protein [Rhodococcus sp. IEGM 1379]|uniref:hypothetical protein n=1 Tax=Rhodococcus sp. IEGM 1379 TaxID=3047086 RepID=UPI0024B83FCA|nr:hypothetical protein [Rhodococcus sp. IEGM 1379]MDI9916906.1 hypothetical protein [Rhodococcus sp. IEGM 1379]
MYRFYVGQIPVGDFFFKIVDERKLPRKVAIWYQSATVLIRRPDGTVYSDGFAYPNVNPVHGIDYRFGSTSPFTMPGEYAMQIKLVRDREPFGVDYTDPVAIDVFEAIE